MNRRIFASLFAGALAGLALTGCGKSGGDSSASTDTGSAGSPMASASGGSAGDSSAGGKIPLAFVTNNASDYWVIARKGTEKAQAELPDVDVQFEIPPNGTADDQKTIINNLLAKGVKGIAISPKDPANQVQLLDDAAKQAVVFTQDSDSPKSDRMCYIGTDNHAAGVQAGEALKKALPSGGTVMVFVGSKDAQNAKDRIAGLEDAIKGTNIKVLDIRTDEADHAHAKSNVSDTLVKYPDIAGLVGIWSYNGPAIASAVKDAGMIGKVKVIAFDQEDGTLQGIKDGIIDATVVQDPFQFGYLAIVDMEKVIKGDKSIVPASRQIIVPTQLIDKAGVDDYWTKLKQMTGKA